MVDLGVEAEAYSGQQKRYRHAIMSRSKHTDPRAMRAARRLRAPFVGRAAGDLSSRRLRGQLAKAHGISRSMDSAAEGEPTAERCRVRIVVQEPRAGFHHPAGKREVRGVLEAIGPVARYGLRSVELVRCAGGGVPAGVAFGRYEAPGRVLLFAQPLPPWRLPGLLRPEDGQRFERAGAVVTLRRDSGATVVEWPEGALERFMLEEVLLHELGHHVLQHEKGKRPVRTARTRDHEAFAERFAARQRQVLHDNPMRPA